jgi:hypothetical protein
MAWIREIDEEEATGHIAETYRKLIKQRGKLSNILKVQGLNAGALDAHLDLYMQLMFGRSKLSRGDRRRRVSRQSLRVLHQPSRRGAKAIRER